MTRAEQYKGREIAGVREVETGRQPIMARQEQLAVRARLELQRSRLEAGESRQHRAQKPSSREEAPLHGGRDKPSGTLFLVRAQQSLGGRRQSTQGEEDQLRHPGVELSPDRLERKRARGIDARPQRRPRRRQQTQAPVGFSARRDEPPSWVRRRGRVGSGSESLAATSHPRSIAGGCGRFGCLQ